MPVAKNSQSGFSLIELLVAVVILAVGLLGLAQLQVTAIKANSQSSTSTAATALAQQVVEKIAAMDADDVMFDAPTAGFVAWPGGSSVTVPGAGTYNITYSTAQVQAAGNNVSNLFKIDVRVESATDVMHVLGNQKRVVTAATIKRAI